MNSTSFVLRGGRIVDPVNGVDTIGDLLVKDGKVAGLNVEPEMGCEIVDVSGKMVIPGVVDTHVHTARPEVGGAGYRMLVKAGVTTAVDLEGPVDVVEDEIVPHGNGINMAVLEGIWPSKGLTSTNGTDGEISAAINRAMDHGALGLKILGGHYPLSPDTIARIIQLTYRERGYVAFHAGSTTAGSDIHGLEQAVLLAGGLPLHIAHINAYCRGLVCHPLEELRRAMDLLSRSSNIVSESHMAPFNGTSGLCQDGVPMSHVTRNCLRKRNYPVTQEGIRQAILDHYASVYVPVGSEVRQLWGEEAVRQWEERGTRVGLSFPVNLRTTALVCATAKDTAGRFIVDALSSDGGMIPRNCILTYGMALVHFGALTLAELVLKSSYYPARMFGLLNKGQLGSGADADIAVIDPDTGKAEMTIIDGQICMVSGVLINRPGRVLTTERGVAHLKRQQVPHRVVDLSQSTYFKGKEGNDGPAERQGENSRTRIF
ncbi:MAG: amidohydrolase family protein [Bacillota bacterium]